MSKTKFDGLVDIVHKHLEAASVASGQPVSSRDDIEAAFREKFGGRRISIPNGSKDVAETRNARIVRDKNAGVPVPVIMERYGLSRAAVYKILGLKKRN